MALGGPPVVIVAAGGFPVTQADNAAPFTVVTADPPGGMPITLADGAYPMTLLDEDGTEWSDTPHASDLLDGETQGLAIDFTLGSGLGEVAVIDTGTPANNKDNVPVDQFLTQSGTSPKLVMGADGLYHWSPHNLLTYSEQLDNAAWTKFTGATVTANAGTAPDGSVTADKVVPVTASRVGVYQIVGMTGAVGTWGIRVKAAGFVWVALETSNFDLTWFNVATGVIGTINSNHTAAISDLGGGWYLCSITTKNFWNGAAMLIVTDADNTQSVTASGSNGVLAWGAQLNRGATALAYHATTSTAWFGVPIEYGGGGYYALVEPQSTNLFLASQALDDAAVTKSSATVSANAVVAPDGTTTGDTLTTTGGGGTGFTRVATPTAAAHTYSMYVKAGTASWVALVPAVATSVVGLWAWFNIAAGVVGTKEGSITASAIQSVGNGWYRCSVTYTAVAATEAFYLRMATADLDTSGAAGLTASFWGAQLELGSVATSPIPTFASTITRAADDISALTSAFAYSATLGTVYADATAPAGSQVGVVWQLDDGSANERILAYRDASNNPLFAIVDGGVAQTAIDTGTWANSARAQTSFAWAANNTAASQDGGAIVADVTATLPAVTTFRVGRDHSASQPNGKIRQLVYVPRRVSDADLPTWRYVP